jgi:hypothetical protein
MKTKIFPKEKSDKYKAKTMLQSPRKMSKKNEIPMEKRNRKIPVLKIKNPRIYRIHGIAINTAVFITKPSHNTNKNSIR